jgi:hypothetical protein
MKKIEKQKREKRKKYKKELKRFDLILKRNFLKSSWYNFLVSNWSENRGESKNITG